MDMLRVGASYHVDTCLHQFIACEKVHNTAMCLLHVR